MENYIEKKRLSFFQLQRSLLVLLQEHLETLVQVVVIWDKFYGIW